MSDLPADRALDVAIATQVFGLTVAAWDWPCAYDPECGQYEAKHTVYPEGAWTGERGPVYVPDGGTWPPVETPDAEFARLGPGFTRAELAGTLWVLPHADVRPVPWYSTDLAAAWDVVEHMLGVGYVMGLYSPSYPTVQSPDWTCYFEQDEPESVGTATGATAPLAICHAALATLAQKE